jgi:hypothetical protein
MQSALPSSTALACEESRPVCIPSDVTLYELVSDVFDAERNRAQGIEAQRRLLKARIGRDSHTPGLESGVSLLRKKLEQLG